MENLNRYQWHVFWAAVVVTGVLILLNLWPLVPIYLDDDLRDRASTVIQATAVREGWLRSGLSIRHIDGQSATLLYRSHLRGADPVRCGVLHLRTGYLSPCENF